MCSHVLSGFFAANIRNPHTRRAYARAARDFLRWCHGHGVRNLADIAPIHVAAWIDTLGQSLATPSVKKRLAAIRHLFDRPVTGQAMATNPVANVRGPAHSSRTGRTPVLEVQEVQALLDAIYLSPPAGLGARTLIGLMIYSVARVVVAKTPTSLSCHQSCHFMKPQERGTASLPKLVMASNEVYVCLS